MNKTQSIKISLLFLIFSFFLNLDLSAQIKISSRLGASTLSDLQLEITKPTNETNTSLYISSGFMFRSYNLAGQGCGSIFPVPFYNNNSKGFSFKIGSTFFHTKTRRKKTKIRNHTIALLLRRFGGKLKVNSTGCSETFYDYNFKASDIGFVYYKDRDLTKDVSYYWAFGAFKRIIKRDRTDMFTNKIVKESLNQNRLFLDIGLRINLNQLFFLDN